MKLNPKLLLQLCSIRTGIGPLVHDDVLGVDLVGIVHDTLTERTNGLLPVTKGAVELARIDVVLPIEETPIEFEAIKLPVQDADLVPED